MIQKLNNIKRSRLKIAMFFGVILSVLVTYAIHKEMEGTATIGIGVLGGMITKLIHDETKRPSTKPLQDDKE